MKERQLDNYAKLRSTRATDIDALSNAGFMGYFESSPDRYRIRTYVDVHYQGIHECKKSHSFVGQKAQNDDYI